MRQRHFCLAPKSAETNSCHGILTGNSTGLFCLARRVRGPDHDSDTPMGVFWGDTRKRFSGVIHLNMSDEQIDCVYYQCFSLSRGLIAGIF